MASQVSFLTTLMAKEFIGSRKLWRASWVLKPPGVASRNDASTRCFKSATAPSRIGHVTARFTGPATREGGKLAVYLPADRVF